MTRCCLGKSFRVPEFLANEMLHANMQMLEESVTRESRFGGNRMIEKTRNIRCGGERSRVTTSNNFAFYSLFSGHLFFVCFMKGIKKWVEQHI